MPASQIEPSAKPGFRELIIGTLRRILGRRPDTPIRDAAALKTFLNTRATFVAQSTLYGYLRTRAGVRFPELFDDDPFVVSVNIAKWQVWLACLSDLAIYAGGMLRRGSHASNAVVGPLMQELVNGILADTGTPAEAGPEFAAHAERVRARIALCDWGAQVDGDAAFVESPSALVYWAPIVDDLKVLDAEIVRNSVRFRWNEIRQQLRQTLDAAAVMATADPDGRA